MAVPSATTTSPAAAPASFYWLSLSLLLLATAGSRSRSGITATDGEVPLLVNPSFLPSSPSFFGGAIVFANAEQQQQQQAGGDEASSSFSSPSSPSLSSPASISAIPIPSSSSSSWWRGEKLSQELHFSKIWFPWSDLGISEWGPNTTTDGHHNLHEPLGRGYNASNILSLYSPSSPVNSVAARQFVAALDAATTDLIELIREVEERHSRSGNTHDGADHDGEAESTGPTANTNNAVITPPFASKEAAETPEADDHTVDAKEDKEEEEERQRAAAHAAGESTKGGGGGGGGGGSAGNLWKDEFEALFYNAINVRRGKEKWEEGRGARHGTAAAGNPFASLLRSQQRDGKDCISRTSPAVASAASPSVPRTRALHPLRAAFNAMFPTYRPRGSISITSSGSSSSAVSPSSSLSYVTPTDIEWVIDVEQQYQNHYHSSHSSSSSSTSPPATAADAGGDNAAAAPPLLPLLTAMDWALPRRFKVPYFGTFDTFLDVEAMDSSSSPSPSSSSSLPLPIILAAKLESHRIPATFSSAHAPAFNSPFSDAMSHYLHYSPATAEIGSWTQLANMLRYMGGRWGGDEGDGEEGNRGRGGSTDETAPSSTSSSTSSTPSTPIPITVVMVPKGATDATYQTVKALTLTYRQQLRVRHLFLLREGAMPDVRPLQWTVQRMNERLVVVDGGARAFSRVSHGKVVSVWEFEVVRRSSDRGGGRMKGRSGRGTTAAGDTEAPHTQQGSGSDGDSGKSLMDITNARIVTLPMVPVAATPSPSTTNPTTSTSSSVPSSSSSSTTENGKNTNGGNAVPSSMATASLGLDLDGVTDFTIGYPQFQLAIQRLLEFGSSVKLLQSLDAKSFQRMYLAVGSSPATATATTTTTISTREESLDDDDDDGDGAPPPPPFSTINGVIGEHDSRQHASRVGKTQRLCRRALKANRRGGGGGGGHQKEENGKHTKSSATHDHTRSNDRANSGFQSLHKYVDRCFNGTIFSVVSEDSGGLCEDALRSIARSRQMNLGGGIAKGRKQKSSKLYADGTPQIDLSKSHFYNPPTASSSSSSDVFPSNIVFSHISIATPADRRFYRSLVSGATGVTSHAMWERFADTRAIPPPPTPTTPTHPSQLDTRRGAKKKTGKRGTAECTNRGDADATTAANDDAALARRTHYGAYGYGDAGKQYGYGADDAEISSNSNSKEEEEDLDLAARIAGSCRVLMIVPLMGVLKPLWFPSSQALRSVGGPAMQLNGGLFNLLEHHNALLEGKMGGVDAANRGHSNGGGRAKQQQQQGSTALPLADYSSALKHLQQDEKEKAKHLMLLLKSTTPSPSSSSLILADQHNNPRSDDDDDGDHQHRHRRKDLIPFVAVGASDDDSSSITPRGGASSSSSSSDYHHPNGIYGTTCLASLRVVITGVSSSNSGGGGVGRGSSSSPSCGICHRLQLVLLPLLSDVLPWLSVNVYDRMDLVSVTNGNPADMIQMATTMPVTEGPSSSSAPSSFSTTTSTPPTSTPAPAEEQQLVSLSSSGGDDSPPISSSASSSASLTASAIASVESRMDEDMLLYLARRVTDHRKLPTPAILLQVRALRGGAAATEKKRAGKRKGDGDGAGDDSDSIFLYHNRQFDDVEALVMFIQKAMANAECPMPI